MLIYLVPGPCGYSIEFLNGEVVPSKRNIIVKLLQEPYTKLTDTARFILPS